MRENPNYDDPIEREQIAVLRMLLREEFTHMAREGFLIVGPRFVDQYGNHRTAELRELFKTRTKRGRRALRISLERISDMVGGLKGFEQRFPVTIIPPRPAFPLFKIIGIETLADYVYRVFDSGATSASGEPVREHIARTGRLPWLPRQRQPVRRSKPRMHWCSYRKWINPTETGRALQILSSWSNCCLRATLRTKAIQSAAYVSFNGDRHDPENDRLRFYGYFYEPVAQDHSTLAGGGLQIGVDGSPKVGLLEQWDGAQWETVWRAG
jgi:hypothetical protein